MAAILQIIRHACIVFTIWNIVITIALFAMELAPIF